ncbi:protein phosphatase 1 regulatory subunit 12A isoform X7 [Drosophila miranda]|uniref:protein phosphatase 1 regulatory subunit 12A isoform X7 n=1 Tax=Drosophila miranda TaxID=7229 RepID=UPI0007E6C2ED|nr:protein phosphatase 1 regulatory subunit 12A isoform X7 [Drosophila miranda]
MSTLDARNNSAMMKRAEQLKRWEESDTNRAAPTPRPGRRIKFSSGCVYLAACLSGEKDEVMQLLDQGADINTANVDGLTALHQACIDDSLPMVEFLVKRGADINRQDNEGWTPLHATASCGFVSIARYLVENGADVAAVNSDGDLALDLAIDVPHTDMIEYMEKIVQELNIDVEQARKAEEETMLSDAERWLTSDTAEVDRPHPKTGATALHVAAAKGYTNVLSLLLEGRGNVDRQDNDGWTPLHAAAHWGQQETSRMLVEALADMDIRNYAGQSCIDVADRKIVKFLEEQRAKNRNQRRPSSQIRISDAIENRVDKTPTKLVRVEVRTDATKDAENVKPNQQQIHVIEHPVEEEAPWRRKMARAPNDSPTNNQVPDRELSTNSSESANDVILRRTQSFENDEKKPTVTHVATPTGTAATAKTTLLSSPSTNALTPPIRSQVTAKTTAQSNNGSSSTASASASDAETAKPPPKQSTGNIIKNFFKSFVPPVRDEESETQRKAHAKRVRETRRSTQGVTLDEIKSAEELVKKKHMGMANNNNNNNDSISSTGSNDTSDTAENTSFISDASQQEPQPPPPPTTPPPAIIPTSDETEIETILAPSPVQSANDTTASFTLSAPSRRSVVVGDDGDGDGDGKAGGDADDPEVVVSASYTIVPRRDKIPDSAESEPEQVESNKQKTDDQQAESEEQKARPTDLPLSAAPTEAIKSSSSTTPGSLESPVRLRDKRGLSGSSQETDTKSDTASSVSAHPDFNARDSLLSLYARRTADGSGGASAAAAAATATGGAGTGAGGAGGSSTSTSTAERRPSWRLKFDAGSKFKLEDNTSGGTYPPNNSTIIPSAPAVMAAANLSNTTGIQRRISSGPNALNASNQSLNSVGRPISAPSESTNNSSAYATPAVRKYETTSTGAGTGVGARAGAAATTTATTTANSVSATSANHAAGTAATTNATSSHDDKENDKENDNRTQTVIQRRRKPKRRSTGVVHLDVDELDPERQNEEKEKDKESGSERTSRSRLGSTTSTAASSTTRSESKGSSDKSENGDGIDYKALWEAAKLENDKLKQVLKQKDDEVVQTRATLERFANATTKNSLSEIEKRERRAMERKLSELEEELKLLQKLKTENDRLRAENRALTRVVSKLTTSAQSQLAKAK